MMMILGQFIFKLQTVPYQQKQHSTAQRFGSNNRIANRPAYQHIGAGEETMTLSGTLYPEVTGGKSSIKKIKDMAATGKPHIMMDADGFNNGYWIIESVQETDSEFFENGIARKIDFTLSLKRTDKPNAS